MKYIRTKKGEIGKLENTEAYIKGKWYSVDEIKDYIIAQADTIEELCDGFFADDGSIETYCKNEFNMFQDYILDTGFDGYGFIKTDKGLIYVAKMDNEGKLCLI